MSFSRTRPPTSQALYWEPKFQNDIEPRQLDLSLWVQEFLNDALALALPNIVPAQLGGLRVASGAFGVPPVSLAGNVVTIWFAGGLENQTYAVMVSAVTANGRTKNFDCRLFIRPVNAAG